VASPVNLVNPLRNLRKSVSVVRKSRRESRRLVPSALVAKRRSRVLMLQTSFPKSLPTRNAGCVC